MRCAVKRRAGPQPREPALRVHHRRGDDASARADAHGDDLRAGLGDPVPVGGRSRGQVRGRGGIDDEPLGVASMSSASMPPRVAPLQHEERLQVGGHDLLRLGRGRPVGRAADRGDGGDHQAGHGRDGVQHDDERDEREARGGGIGRMRLGRSLPGIPTSTRDSERAPDLDGCVTLRARATGCRRPRSRRWSCSCARPRAWRAGRARSSGAASRSWARAGSRARRARRACAA